VKELDLKSGSEKWSVISHFRQFLIVSSEIRKEAYFMREIFCPNSGLAASYPTMLRHLYSINDLLKKDGILAPSDSSLTNTSRLYDLIGRPLDKIPTLHVGGTNGKVIVTNLFFFPYSIRS
jgi:hypothetical protein